MGESPPPPPPPPPPLTACGQWSTVIVQAKWHENPPHKNKRFWSASADSPLMWIVWMKWSWLEYIVSYYWVLGYQIIYLGILMRTSSKVSRNIYSAWIFCEVFCMVISCDHRLTYTQIFWFLNISITVFGVFTCKQIISQTSLAD